MAKKTPKSRARRGTGRARGAPASKRTRAKAGFSAQQIGPRADVDSVRELVELMVTNDLSEVNITNGKTSILLRRGVPAAAPLEAPVVVSAAVPAPAAPTAQEPAEAVPDKEELIEIKSPMVGTFYAASGPESDPYVTVGAEVSEDTVVCVIEAMKVMNEIKAECAGAITEICVMNAQPVEFGQALFKVKPA